MPSPEQEEQDELTRSGPHHKTTAAKQRRQKVYLQAIRDGFRPGEAATLAEVRYSTVKNQWRRDPEFLEDEADAIRATVELAESVVFDSVRNGNVNDAKWWLKHHAPETYGEKKTHQHQVTGKITHELQGRERAEQLLNMRNELTERTASYDPDAGALPEVVPEGVTLSRDD